MKRAVRWAIGLVAGAVFLAPLAWLLAASFLPSSSIFDVELGGSPLARDWTLANYPNAFRRAGLGRALLNSLLQVLTIALGGLLVNSMAAFAFARLSFRGREPLFAVVVSLIILPVEVLAVPMFLTTRDLGLFGSTAPVVVALSLPFVAKAFNVYFLRQQFLSWPTELEEAAVLDGASTWRVFWSVALPSIRPALATVLLLDVVTHWSDFLWPLLVTPREGSRTVQIGLANLFTEPPIDWGAILACAVLATLPVMVAFRSLQRHVVQADARVGLR